MITDIELTGAVPVSSITRKLTQRSLEAALQRHSDWISGEPQGQRAELSFLNLSGLDFSGWTLDGANFYMSELANANFQRSSLVGCSFMKARCDGADFAGASLRGAVFSYANLSGCNFYDSDLRNCQGNRKEIKSLMVIDGWPITYTNHVVCVGCVSMTYAELEEYNNLPNLDTLVEGYGEGVLDAGLMYLLKNVVADQSICNPEPSKNENTYPTE